MSGDDYFVRLTIDGADSPLELTAGVVTGPKVTLA
jgi:hypothetical protein